MPAPPSRESREGRSGGPAGQGRSSKGEGPSASKSSESDSSTQGAAAGATPEGELDSSLADTFSDLFSEVGQSIAEFSTEPPSNSQIGAAVGGLLGLGTGLGSFAGSLVDAQSLSESRKSAAARSKNASDSFVGPEFDSDAIERGELGQAPPGSSNFSGVLGELDSLVSGFTGNPTTADFSRTSDVGAGSTPSPDTSASRQTRSGAFFPSLAVQTPETRNPLGPLIGDLGPITINPIFDLPSRTT